MDTSLTYANKSSDLQAMSTYQNHYILQGKQAPPLLQSPNQHLWECTMGAKGPEAAKVFPSMTLQ
jgi:hypothetical protein